jgi:hypothetical protein
MKHTDDSGVLEAFGRYTQAFQALDARAVARHFHEPAFFITPKDVVSLPTAEAVEQTYARDLEVRPPAKQPLQVPHGRHATESAAQHDDTHLTLASWFRCRSLLQRRNAPRPSRT